LRGSARRCGRWFKLAADRGNPSAQVSLGVFYGTAWLAAEQGNATEQTTLGVFYETAEVLPYCSSMA
jgi:TPR repeat protein